MLLRGWACSCPLSTRPVISALPHVASSVRQSAVRSSAAFIAQRQRPFTSQPLPQPHSHPPPRSTLLGDRRRPLRIFDLHQSGPLNYEEVWGWQQRFVRDKVAMERTLKRRAKEIVEGDHAALDLLPSTLSVSSGLEDILLLVEHTPIYTLGRNASLEHLRFPPEVEVEVVGRGEVSKGRREERRRREEENSNSNSSGTAATASTAPDTSASSSSSSSTPTHFQLLRVERGGEVTYHGPGQLVMYPLLALNPAPIFQVLETEGTGSSTEVSDSVPADSSPADPSPSSPSPPTPLLLPSPYRSDLHWFLRSLESVVIRFLDLYGVRGERLEGASGVWVRMEEEEEGHASTDSSSPSSPPSSSPYRKIAAMGLSCSSWVSMHGLALNIDLSLQPYEFIVPCGLEDHTKYGGVTSLKEILQKRREGSAAAMPTAANTPASALTEAAAHPSSAPVELDLQLIRQQLIRCFLEEFGLDPRSTTLSHQPPEWPEVDGS